MIFFLLFLTSAQAEDIIPRPEAPTEVAGECSKVYPVRKGEALPLPMLIPNTGKASCSAVLVPLSHYADLLATEEWGKAVAQQYRINTAALTMERDWYKQKFEQESQPKPWLERPATQRWFGRLETLVTVGVVAAGLGAAYSYGSRDFR
jgi:hypothetical protein